MSTTTQTIGALSAENKTFYERALLSRLVPNLVYAKYGQKKPVPAHEGGTVSFRRFGALSPATAALTEGVTPDGSNLSITTVTATPAQYGDFVQISDKLDLVGIDPVLTETAELLGEAAALTVDTLVRDVVCAGTNVQYAGGRASRNALTAANVLTAAEVRKAVKTLRAANAKPIDGGFFIGIVPPNVASDLMADALWQDVSKYNGGDAILRGEIGKLCGVRFVESTNVPAAENSSGVTVYSCMIIGSDAYGVVDVEHGATPRLIVKPFGSGGTSDPLDQRATAGYKLYMTAVRLQESAMIRIECAAGA